MPDFDPDVHDPMAERAVLACCLHSDIARKTARDALGGDDFYEPVHEEIFDALNRLDRQGMTVDPPSVMAVLRSSVHADRALRTLPDLWTYPAVVEAVAQHCQQVRLYATKRRLWSALQLAQQDVMRPGVDMVGLAAGITNRFAAIRDTGGSSDDIEAMTVEELMLEVDDEPDWLIPGFLERGDRFVLTGEEGLGKSHLLRQIVILASAGLDPFRPGTRIEPIKGMVIDFENSKRQVRRRLWSTYDYALGNGRGAPGLATILCLPRSDITADRVLSRLHRELDACQPDLLVIGPLYKMSNKALQDDTDAGPVLAALDTIRDRGIALLIEAHAGHTKGAHNQRDLRPRGSSALLGWPEFGYGLKRTHATGAKLIPWRGDRDAREFPTSLAEVEGRWEEERAISVSQAWRQQQAEDWSDLAEDDE